MPETEGSHTQTQSQGSSRGRSNHGRRGGRGGKGQRPNNGRPVGGANAPGESGSSQTPTQAAPQNIGNSTSSETKSRSGRNRRNQRGRGDAARAAPTTAPGRRSFGGHLTSSQEEQDECVPAASLSADAPEFVPGQPVLPRSKPQKAIPSRPKQPAVKLPKSTAVDLGTRIHEDISHANYECAICTDDVLRSSHVWSCTLCWTVVHLKCAKRWYINQMKQQELQSAQPRSDATWRCPGCNSKLTDDPGTYHCWCGKDINPKPASASLPPHSCGQTCSKPRPTCPHPCPLQCHAGPCPPCGLMGPTQSCFCGKNESRKPCRETDYENGWSCQEVCGDLLPCGEHTCDRLCHSGLCGDCSLQVDARCFCGRLEKKIPCFEREDTQRSFSPRDGTWFEGTFSCQLACDREYDCGVHKCSEICHPQDESPAHCPFAPDVVTHCPCGKTALAELPGDPRTNCDAPVPHCDKVCQRVLPCGHFCTAKCHDGACGTCLERVDISCRCGRTTTQSFCHQGNIVAPMCMRTCQANLSCGRHKCGEYCCPGEKKASERQAARRKHRVTADTTAVEAEHICIRTCGRPLKCGSHNCQQICHRGPCAACPEAIFHEISCACGRTVLQPPQPCGTRAPECRFNCRRQPECGHPPVEHNCHPDDVKCPKCPFLVEKWCACGKEKLKSQPCHLQEARCGKPCGKKLKCGLHFCKKLCHRPGECEDVAIEGNRCGQSCGKTKMFCEHKCQNPCHGQTPCNETASCTAKATVSCPCGVRTQEVKCLASSSNPDPVRPEIKCDDECLRLERNRRLAAALNIDPATHTNDHIPYSDATLRLFKENTTWCETQEREFRVFAQSANEVRMRYKPMPNNQRQFLHVLAEDYGLESRSEDVEPYRYVLVFKGPRFVSAPSKTLAQCIRIQANQAAEAAAAAAASQPPSPPLGPALDPLNALLLTSPRFGLTIDEVTTALAKDLSQQPSITFKTNFLPSDEILLRATVQYSSFLSPAGIEKALGTLKPSVAETVRKQEIAGNVLLCHVDEDNQITRRDDIGRHDAAGGWSAVAGRAASKKESSFVEEPPARTGGRKLLGLKKKKLTEKESDRAWASQLNSDVEC